MQQFLDERDRRNLEEIEILRRENEALRREK